MPAKPKILVWQWGRFGAGPRIAFELARALQRHCEMDVLLSLAQGAELLDAPMCREAVDLPMKTYSNASEFAVRTVLIRQVLGPMLKRLEHERPDMALCVMPGYWDMLLIKHLRRLNIPVTTIVHDAVNRQGDRFQLINWMQKRTIEHSAAVVTLTDFVTRRLRNQGLLENTKHRMIPHPALIFPDLKLSAPLLSKYPQRKPLRLLLTGRLRKYKGIDLFLAATSNIDPARLSMRIAGSVNDQSLLSRAQNLSNVDVQTGWLSEKEFVSQIDWSDVVVLPYTEASQSGIIPKAYARRRPVIATPIGGLPEQVTHGVNGLLTSEISAEAVTREILRFLDAPDVLHACANGAYDTAQKELGWGQIGTQFAQFLNEVIQQN